MYFRADVRLRCRSKYQMVPNSTFNESSSKSTNVVYNQSFWLNMLQSNPRCVSLCVSLYVSVFLSVCLSVCMCHLYSPNRWTDFDETFHKSSERYLPVNFFDVFKISTLITSWRLFCIFALRHSHGRIFGPIFSKFGHKVLWYMPVFATENQQDRLITSGDREYFV